MADTFTGFCDEWNVTPEERTKLARHLATLRAEATLKLGDPVFHLRSFGDVSRDELERVGGVPGTDGGKQA